MKIYVVCTHQNCPTEMILMRTLTIPLFYRRSKTSLNYPHLPPDLVLWLTFSDSKSLCWEQISMVCKIFKPMKFNCRFQQLWITKLIYIVWSVWKKTGPSCSKLKMSLVNESLKFTSSDTQICRNFCWKNVSSFCSAIATHIFSAKNIRILYIESAKIVNEMTLNKSSLS